LFTTEEGGLSQRYRKKELTARQNGHRFEDLLLKGYRAIASFSSVKNLCYLCGKIDRIEMPIEK